jgi:hypothetical protein
MEWIEPQHLATYLALDVNMCIYKKQSGCFSWDSVQATHIQKHISIWMFQLGLHPGNMSVHEHNIHKILWMPYFLMVIKKTNTRTRQTPYAWLMEIIWLQTLNHKSCSSNVILQNRRNHNHLWKKQDRSLASPPSLGNNQLTQTKIDYRHKHKTKSKWRNLKDQKMLIIRREQSFSDRKPIKGLA